MKSITEMIGLGLYIEHLAQYWWFRVVSFGLFVGVFGLFFYKDIRYWIEEYKKKKNEPNAKKKRKWVVTSWTKEESNPILYFFFVLAIVGFLFSFIITLTEKF